jgi:hypothetical protein
MNSCMYVCVNVCMYIYIHMVVCMRVYICVITIAKRLKTGLWACCRPELKNFFV